MSPALTLNQQIAVPRQNIEGYTKAIKAIPTLNPEEERELAERLHRDNDLEAARMLIMSHLRFVTHVARSYQGYGLPQSDLIQEGNIGLMKAVKRFDPGVGVRLMSFAVHWIRAEMHEYILRNWRIVKVATTKSQRKLFFNLRHAKKQFDWLTPDEAETIAEELGVNAKDVLEMEQRLSTYDLPFESPFEATDDDDADMLSPAAYLEDNSSNPAVVVEQNDWEEHGHEQLRQALAKLDARSQDIVQKRWLSEEKVTLQELAKQYHLSAERIRQIESNALKKLRQSLTHLYNPV